MMSVSSDVAAVPIAKIAALLRVDEPNRHSSAAAAIEGPITLRMSTFSRSSQRWDHPRKKA